MNNDFYKIKKELINDYNIFSKINISDNDYVILNEYYYKNLNQENIKILLYNKLLSIFQKNLFFLKFNKYPQNHFNDKTILIKYYYKLFNNKFNIDNYFDLYIEFKKLNFKIDYTDDDKNLLFYYYINQNDFNEELFFKIYDETKRLYDIYINHFKYFGIHGWDKYNIKNRFSYLFNNVREKVKSNESINYITTLPIIGEQILSHLKSFERDESLYKFDNGIDIPSLLFIPYHNNQETEKHNIIIQDMINISYDNNGEYLVPLSKIYLLRKILHRGYSINTAKEIIDKYANDSKIILDKYKDKLNDKNIYQLELNSNRTCDNIHKIEGNIILEKYDYKELLLQDIILHKNKNNKILLLGSLSMMEWYKGNDKILIDPWVLVGSNMGYISWNAMINKAAVSCILDNNDELFSSIIILEKNPSSIYYADMYDTIKNNNKNNFKYLGFFLIRFKNEDDINLNINKLCSISINNNETKNFSNSKEKYYVMFVILDESVENYVQRKYMLLNFKCNLLNWGNVSDNRRYLLIELQQIMCMYANKKINTFVLLKKNNNQKKQINELCNTQYEDTIGNTTKKKNNDCIEAWYRKDIYDYLLRNNISLYTNIIKKEEILKTKDIRFINKDTIKDLYTIYVLTSKYSLEEINIKLENKYLISYIENYKVLILDDYYLFESYFLFDNDNNLIDERLLLTFGKFNEKQYKEYSNNLCINEECKDIIELDNIRNTKLNIYYHDKTSDKMYDIDDLYNKNYNKYENKELKYDLDIYKTKISKLKFLCYFIKKNKGNKCNIDIDKEYSTLIINNYKIHEKLNILCKNIWNLLHKLYNKDRIINIFKINIKEFNIGKIIPTYENFEYVIYNGNIRERGTLINMIYYSCDVIWDILFLYYKNKKVFNYKYQTIKEYVNEIYLESKILFIESQLGLKFHEIIEICKYNDNYTSSNNEICDNFTQDKNQNSSLCFMTTDLKYIIKTQKSIKPYYRTNSYKKILIDINDIYPKLSCREIKYAQQNNLIKDNKISWNTGQKAWNPNVNSFFYKLFLKYNKKFITGYSGSADVIYNCGLIFNSDINFLILLSIGYMCHHKDHSIHEILFASKSYDVDYNINDNEYEFVEQLLSNL